MNDLDCLSTDAAESREQLSKDLINQARSLLFSVRMIIGLLGVSGRALHDDDGQLYGVLKIRLSETNQYSKLLEDVKKSLSVLDQQIIAFLRRVHDEGPGGAEVGDCKVGGHIQSLNDLHLILNQSISLLSRLA